MPPEALHLLARPMSLWGTCAPSTSLLRHPLPSRSARYTGSCDPRRGKLSTLAPCKRPSSITSDICGPFDRQTALFPSQILPYCTSFLLLCPDPLPRSSRRDRKSSNATQFDRITSWKRFQRKTTKIILYRKLSEIFVYEKLVMIIKWNYKIGWQSHFIFGERLYNI